MMVKFKWAKFKKHIPLDAADAAARSLHQAAAIDHIVPLVVRGDDVLLIADAIDAERNK